MNSSIKWLITFFIIIVIVTLVISDLVVDRWYFNDKNCKTDKKQKITLQLINKNETFWNLLDKNTVYFTSPHKLPYKSKLLRDAKLCLSRGEFKKAEHKLKTLLLFSSRNTQAWSLLGGIYFLSGRYEKAEAIFNKVLEIRKLKEYSGNRNIKKIFIKY